MRNYSHRIKSYTKQDLEGKELFLIRSWWFSDRIDVQKLDVDKVTDKTVMLAGGGRLPIDEVGLNKEHGRLVCPKEDIDEVVDGFRKSMTKMYQEEIDRLNEEIYNLNNARINIQPSHMEQRKMAEEKLKEKGEN